MFPAWVWTKDPARRFLTVSYAAGLSTRDAVRSRRLLKSAWYQARWGDLFFLTGDQNQKKRYENNRTGFRIASSVGGEVTGERAQIRIIDDPHKPEEALSDQVREATIDWIKTTWSTRESDPRKSGEIIVMQRLHEHDVSGYLIEEVGGYEHVMLPMRFEKDRCSSTSLGFVDPRKEEGDLLCPERFDEASVANLEKRLTVHAAGQLQQRPAALEGEIFKAKDFRFWYPGDMPPPPPWQVRMKDGEFYSCAQMELPERFDRQAQSWDMSYKDSKTSDFVAGQVWGKRKANVFLLDQEHGHMDFPATCDALVDLTVRWPKTGAKWIEDAANGPAVISSLRMTVPGMIPLTPKGSKEARAHAITPFVVAGNIYLPHPSLYHWVQDLLMEITQFPKSKYDDRTDALTQAVSNLLLNGIQVPDRMKQSNTQNAHHRGEAAMIVSGDY